MRKALHLKSNIQALATIEFALILPLLLLMLYGVIEMTRYIYFNQKLESTSAQISNLVNQNYNVSDKSIDTIFAATKKLMEPFDNSNLTMVITNLTQTVNPTTDKRIQVKWQVTKGKAGVKSKFAPSGDCGKNPNDDACKIEIAGMTFKERDQIIIVEVFSEYSPLLNFQQYKDIINTNQKFYKYTIARPRYGSFSTAP